MRCVQSEGMPTHRNPYVKGDLFVVFTVTFPSPNVMDDRARAQLQSILPQPAPLGIDEDNEDLEIHFVKNISPQDRPMQQRGEAYDEDDERMGGAGGGQRVQCAQQ
eukprot:CAMPEP_0113844008 /NCGR_PEP_ID=MMETSP0372-20130328/18_1 /TAXON_ID=340204 /ORGANISM="Lankesteria abbotti" /LENGTH=105 /DNA_ID=CAMNT_0000813003 /DNA_START=688 /DNA_END=1005 /DNA_ORIENTATION=+ /assembly_acc=CAM_ASM_000359